MKKIIILLFLIGIFISCEKSSKKDVSTNSSTFSATSYKFDEIEKQAKGSSVNIYMYGGAEEINKYIDNIIAPALKKNNDITLNRVPLSNIKDIINKLIIEKQAEKKVGTVDILWVNGENFKLLKDSNVLWGNFIQNLPNITYIKNSTLEKDFGEDINGLEAPWGEAQFNFIFNDINNSNIFPFKDSKTLLEFAKLNPGKFTYPTVIDHTGSAFVRNIAIDILGYNEIQNMDDKTFEKELISVWNYLEELKPYLWRKGETYPESEGKLDSMFLTGELNITMGYTINKVNSKISANLYPKTSKSFLLEKGTLFNNHYLSIMENSPNKAGALYVINYLLSPEAQLSKQNPDNWGDFTVIDYNKISQEYKNNFSTFLNSENMPSFDEFSKKRVKELSPSKLKIIETGWLKNIGKNYN